MAVVPLTIESVHTFSGPGGASAACVRHWLDIGGDFDDNTADFIAGAFGQWWSSLANEDWSYSGAIRFLDLTTDPPGEIFSGVTGDTGQGTGNTLPAQCAFVVSLSAGASRRRRGRIYLPGIGENDVDDASLVSSGFVTAALDGFTTMAADIASNVGYVPAVYSRTDGVARAVAGIGADRVIDTQRRRVQRLAS